MSGILGSSGAAASGGGAGSGTGGPLQIKACYTGVNENINASTLGASAFVDLADWKPGAVRYIRQEGQGPDFANATGLDRHYPVPRTVDLCNAGVFCIPCIEHTFSSTTNFKNFLANWIDRVDNAVENPPLWWEIGNEPRTPPGTTDAAKALMRSNYYAKMVAASEVLEARGKKLIMCAWITYSGGTEVALQEIEANVDGTDPSMVHAMAIHVYGRQGLDQPPGTAFNTTGGTYQCIKDQVFGFRNLFDSYDGFRDKPIFVTETGLGCSYRANGTNPGGSHDANGVPQGGDWGVTGTTPNKSKFTDGKTGPEVRRIPLTDESGGGGVVRGQASMVRDTLDGLTQSRTALNLGAVTIFCYADYGLPSGDGYMHYGALDKAKAKRPVYNTLKTYQRAFGTTNPPASGNIVPVGGPGGFAHADLVKNYEFAGPNLPGDWTADDDHSNFGSFSNSDTNFEASQVTIVDDAAASGGKAVELELTNVDKGGDGNTGCLLHTAGNFTFRGGYVEFRAKMPTHDAGWIGLWTSGFGHAWAGWGEIDVVETLGDAQTPQAHYHRSDSQGGSGDYDPAWDGGGRTIANAATAYHTYAVHWEPGVRLRWYYDGSQTGLHLFDHTGTTNGNWVPSSPAVHEIIIYLIKTNGGTVPGGGITARVDYVRVWQ
jgi:hypothetical protein